MSTVSLNFEGAQGIAAGLDALSRSVETLAQRQTANTRATQAGARASTQAAGSMESLAQSAQRGVQRFQSVASAVQSLVGQLGGESRTAGLVSSLAANVVQFSMLGSALGPGGAVIGGLAAASAGIYQIATQSRDAAEAAAELRTELEHVADARIAAREREAFDREVESGAIGAGRSTEMLTREREIARVELERNVAELREHRDRVTEIRSTYEAAGRAVPEGLVDTLNRETAALREGNAEIRARAEALGEEIDARAEVESFRERADRLRELAALHEPERAGGGRRSGAAPEDPVDEGAFLERMGVEAEAEGLRRRAEAMGEAAAAADRWRAEDAEDFEAWAERRREAEEAALDASRESAEAHRALLAESSDAYAAFADEGVRSVTAVVEAWEEYNDAAKAAGVQTLSTGRLLDRTLAVTANNIADSVGNKMTGAFEQAVGAWLDGSLSFVEAAEKMAQGVIKSLTQEAIVQTVVELARSVASFASQDYAGGIAHAGAAAAWAAVGVVAGSVGAATGAFGGGGQGGATSRDGESAERERGETSSGPVTVNLYYDGLPVTQSEVGAGVARGLRTAQRHGYLPATALRGR